MAIAGIMGGLATEVGDSTRTILLEEAYFDPVCIRTTERRLALPSEASFRFERIVDIEKIDWASRRTTQLIVQLAGGRVAQGVVDAYPRKHRPLEVTMRLARLNRLLGIEVPAERAMKILSALQFEPRLRDDFITCTVPTWRSDVDREVDLIEEVARVYGYDKVPTRKRIQIEATPADRRQKLAQAMGTFLNGCGFYETINVDFVDQAVADLFSAGGTVRHLGVRDVTRKAGNLLRRSLLASLLGVLKTNVNAKNLPCRIYEIADTFIPTDAKDSLPLERAKLGLVVDGDLRLFRRRRGIGRQPQPCGHSGIRARGAALGAGGGPRAGEWPGCGRSGSVLRRRSREIRFQRTGALRSRVGFRRVDGSGRRIGQDQADPAFPGHRARFVDRGGRADRWARVARPVQEVAPAELENVRFVDIYRGKGVAPGTKSVTLSLRFRDEDGTLTHEAVDKCQAAILESLRRAVGAELRTL